VSESRAPTQGGLAGIREVLRVAYRRKFIILVPAVLLSGIGWAMASKAVPLFTATAALTLDVSKVQIVDREVVSQLPLETSTLRSEIDVIRSRSLNDEVVVLLGLASDPGVAGSGRVARVGAGFRQLHRKSAWPFVSRHFRAGSADDAQTDGVADRRLADR
jgi:succinoglycan biosynthesis transport protein ExoP